MRYLHKIAKMVDNKFWKEVISNYYFVNEENIDNTNQFLKLSSLNYVPLKDMKNLLAGLNKAFKQ